MLAFLLQTAGSHLPKGSKKEAEEKTDPETTIYFDILVSKLCSWLSFFVFLSIFPPGILLSLKKV